jgi:uncharacterized protein (DUF4415 family)
MSTTSMKLKSGRVVQLPTRIEAAQIARGIAQDPGAASLTATEWQAVQPRARMGRPPKSEPFKVPTTIRFDADVLAALKGTGRGWQTRVNEAMRHWVKRHPSRV